MERLDTTDFDPKLNRMRLAYHEAGHAVATWAFGIALRSVVAGEAHGHAERAEEDDLLQARRGKCEMHRAAAIILLAGEAAQKRWQPQAPSNGCNQDRADARSHAEALGQELGDDSEHDRIPELQRFAEQLIVEHWPQVKVLAHALVKHATIPGPTAVRIIESAASRPADLSKPELRTSRAESDRPGRC